MEENTRRSGLVRKAVGLFASVATLLTGGVIAASAASTASAATASTTSYDRTLGNATFEAARQKYGLTKEMKDGAILHAWEWSFNTISANMADIAAAGYTSIQTEPIQKCKQNTANGMKFDENWYYVYQPIDTQVGNFVVGTEAEFKAMCAKAHEYGIRIIVDVVANHMTADFGAIQGRWANASLYHPHESVGDHEWGDRYKVTHKCLLGLWDIDSNNPDNGKAMQSFLQEVVQDGADGFRFDAAKHIELPGEFPSDSNGSPYWTYILNNGAQYQYGEVLQDSISRDNDYANLFSNASSNGGGVTASQYGYTIRDAIKNSNLNAGSLGNYSSSVNPDRLVTWVESHDNYANTDKLSVSITDYQLTMGWAIIGARAEGAPLFFDRPYGSGGNNAQFTEQTKLGDKGSDLYKDSQVAAVNHFRNQLVGSSEYLANCGSNSCLMIERYKSDGNVLNDGVTIANMGGDVNLSGTAVKLDNGTYTDEVNGGTITVSNGTITSGTAKGGKVSVFYNRSTNLCSMGASVADGKSFTTNTLDVTLTASSNCKTTTYNTSEGASGSFSNGKVVTLGGSTAVGNTVTLTLNATDSDGNTYTSKYTYKKKDPNAVSVAYATKPASWSNLYAYVYIDDSSAASITQNAAWPGVAMTKLTASDGCADAGMYKYEVPSDFEGTVRIIFTDGQTGTSTKYPADTAQGVDAAGLLIDGTYYWDGGTSWTEKSCGTTTVNSIAIDQADYTTDISNGATTKKLTATVDPSTASVSWSSSDSSVASVASDGTVTAKKAGTATITAKAGTKTASIKVTVTGTVPVAKNRIYVTAPSWSTVYAYMYTGDGSSAVSNATWPGVALTKISGTDNCGQSSYYYDVPDNMASGAKVIFSDNGSSTNRYPADKAPGMDYNGGTMSWKVGDTSLSAVNCKPVPVPVSSVSVSPSSVSLQVGGSRQLSATVSPSNATDRTVTWSSSDASVASVSSSGVVKALKAGSATVTAKAGGRSASVSVVVKAAGSVTVPVSMVSVSGSKTVSAGSSVRLSATVSPANATDKTVVWGSSNPKIATVSSDGTVTGVAKGSVTIFATAGNVSAAFDVSVKELTGDSLGVRRSAVSYLRNTLSQGYADTTVEFGRSTDQVLVGDWDGDGKDTLAVRRGTTLYLQKSISSAAVSTSFDFGRSTDQVLVGDWNGDGKDTFGIRRGNVYYLYNSLSYGSAPDVTVEFGRSTDQVLVGDWDGDGKDTLAVRRGTTLYLQKSISSAAVSTSFDFGRSTDQVLVGDWNGDGKDTFGVRRGTTMYLSTALGSKYADVTMEYGRSTDQVLVGNWDGK